MEAFPFIDVSGPPDERGLQYGRQARDRIQRSVELYGGRIERLGLGRDDLARLVEMQDIKAPPAGPPPLGIEGTEPTDHGLVLVGVDEQILHHEGHGAEIAVELRLKGRTDRRQSFCDGAVMLVVDRRCIGEIGHHDVQVGAVEGFREGPGQVL